MKKAKKYLALVLALVMALSLVACGAKEEEAAVVEEEVAPKKIAVLFNSTITDGGFNEGLYKHIQELQAQYGFELSYQENVDDTAVNDVLRNYAADGYDLVLDAEQYHCEQIAEIAPEFPDTYFGCINGYVAKAPNFISVTSDQWQHVYLGGVMAGAVSKSGKIGIITYSTNSDSALKMRSAFESGAQIINPDCECIHVATGSFSDIAAGKEQAAALIAQGCDVIMCNSGDCNPSVIDYCVEQGVYSVSCITDRNDLYPEYLLGSAATDNNAMMDTIVIPFLEGTLECTDDPIVGDLANGVEVFKIHDTGKALVDQSVLDTIDETAEKIKSGEIVNVYLADPDAYKEAKGVQ